jgi:hypothetical protein
VQTADCGSESDGETQELRDAQRLAYKTIEQFASRVLQKKRQAPKLLH